MVGVEGLPELGGTVTRSCSMTSYASKVATALLRHFKAGLQIRNYIAGWRQLRNSID